MVHSITMIKKGILIFNFANQTSIKMHCCVSDNRMIESDVISLTGPLVNTQIIYNGNIHYVCNHCHHGIMFEKTILSGEQSSQVFECSNEKCENKCDHF